MLRLFFLTLFFVINFFQACSQQSLYDSTHQLKLQECYQKTDKEEVKNCLKNANMSYQHYQTLREERLNR